MPLVQHERQCSQFPPLGPIQQIYPTRPPTHAQPVSYKPVSNSPLSQTPTKQLQPTQILTPLQPVSLTPITTLPEEDDPEPDQHEPEQEQQEPEPDHHKPEPELSAKVVPRDFDHTDGTPDYGKASSYIKSVIYKESNTVIM